MTTLLTLAIALPNAFAKAPIGDKVTFPSQARTPSATFADKDKAQALELAKEVPEKESIIEVDRGEFDHTHSVDDAAIEELDQEEISIEDEAREDFRGQIDLVAVVDARQIEGDITLPDGPVAVFSIRDISILGHSANSIYVEYDAEFDTFGPDALVDDASIGMEVFRFDIHEMSVLITSEADIGAIISLTETPEFFDGKRPVLVDSRYLNARVDADFAMLVGEMPGGLPVTAQSSAFPVDVDQRTVSDYLMAPVDRRSSVGFIGAGDEDTDNAWHEGIELGVDWMEYVVWERNAPGQ